MATDPWSVDSAARELCGCAWCSGNRGERGMPCFREIAARGIKAGLTRAAEVAGARADFWAAKDRSPVTVVALDEAEACERAIRSLLSQ